MTVQVNGRRDHSSFSDKVAEILKKKEMEEAVEKTKKQLEEENNAKESSFFGRLLG